MTDRANIGLAVGFFSVALAGLLLIAVVFPRRRHTRAADPLVLLIAAIAVWCGAYGLSFADVSLTAAGRWLDQTYWGILVAPTALLLFVARYTGRDAWLSQSVVSVLLAVPAAFAVAVFSPWTRPWFLGSGRDAETAVLQDPGFVYWAYYAYGSALIVAAAVIVIAFARDHHAQHRRASALLVLAMALPTAGSVASSMNRYLFGVDPTVIGLAATTAIFAFLVLRAGLLDVGQLAREEVLNALRDGFLALDRDHTVVDANGRALQLLGLPAGKVLQQPLRTALTAQPALLDAILGHGGGLVTLDQWTPQERLLLVETLPLHDREDALIGHAVVLRDQTRIYVDELTKVGNRRFFFDQVPSVVSLCHRTGVPVALAVIDLDGLKGVNDHSGHLAGDHALAVVGRELRLHVRAVDVLARTGGDEFAVLMPGADEDAACEIAMRIRDAVRQVQASPALSVSVGVTVIGEDDALLHAMASADRALYEAKARGRDRVVRFSELAATT